MTDIVNRINAVHRAVREQRIPAGDGTSTLLRRRFDTPVEDLWEACTTPERLARWLAPVAGDLREGGTYQLEGNARGDILRCEPPRLLKVNWVYGENVTEADISEVELRLTPDGADATLLELEHTAVADPEMWTQYGPGATGVGWDLGLLGLTLHLEGEPAPDDETFHTTPDGREFISRSSNAWAAANVAAGASPEEAERKAANTTAFFAPES